MINGIKIMLFSFLDVLKSLSKQVENTYFTLKNRIYENIKAGIQYVLTKVIDFLYFIARWLSQYEK